MPKYWGSQTDEDDVQVEEANGVLVDFSTLDPEAKEPVRVPPPALRSAGTARQWYLTEGPGKNKGDKLSVPRATNVKPVEKEWGGTPLKLPNQDVLEKGVRREGAIAREARKHLPGTPEYRGGAIGTRADQQVAHLDEREAGLTLPTSDQSPLDRLSTAIGGRANPILARALEDPSEKRVKFPSLEELQGVANSLSGTIEEKPTTPGGFIDAAVKQTMPGRLYQAGKKFTTASGSLPKALYEYGETLFTPRLAETAKAIGETGMEGVREGIGIGRQVLNARHAAEIERQRAEAKKTGRPAPYTLPDTHAETMRQAKMFESVAKGAEGYAEQVNTTLQAGAGLAEVLATPTNLALMKAPGAIARAAKRGGEVSSITGLGETSVAQRWREGAAKAGAESNAALAEAKTLKDAATSATVKQAGLETPEAVEGTWKNIKNLLTSDVNPGLVPGKGWWNSPMRTATVKRAKAEILNLAAKASVNEPLMHWAVGAYYTREMARNLPQNFERITQGGEEFFRTGDQKKLQEILPDITSAAMLFMMAKHQLAQARGNLGGERFRTDQGIAEYRQRTRMPSYDLTDAKIQKDFVKEAFVGKRVVDHGDGLYGIRQGNSLDLARVKFVKPEDVKVEVDPATGEKKAHDAWITPPTAGAPPTIHLVAKTDMGLIKHEQTHLLTDMGALTGSLRDVERELGLEHGAIQDIPGIVKLRAELEARQKTAPPEAQKNIADQIARLDKAAKGIEAFPELVERTLGTSSTYEDSIAKIYKIKNGPMPNILDVFEAAKKGDRAAAAEIHDRGLGDLYTDTMILGSPEQVAKARRNQWFETAKFLLTGKKSAADVARDIAEGRFNLTDAKPPNPLYTAEEIAGGKEPAVEAPPVPAPVDAVGRLREVATQNATLSKQFAEMEKAKAPVEEMRTVAEALTQSDRDLHRAQADAAEQMKRYEADAAKRIADFEQQAAAVDVSTPTGKLDKREIVEKADAINKELEELRGFMRKPASPEPPAPPPFPGSVEEKQAAAMDEAMAQETVPPPPIPERRSPTRKKFVDMPLEEAEAEIRRLITDPERAESVFEVVRESRRDPLTGAKNLKAWELDAKRDENPIIVRSDHDKFKLINDNVSHAAGDQVLKDYVAAAHELGIDIYRIGGDEFRFLFKTPEDASRAMESLRDVIRRSEYDLDTPNGVARFGGVDISYGIGETDALADAAAQGQKESKPNRGPRFDQLKGKPVTSEAGGDQPSAAPAGGDAGRVYVEGRRYEDPRSVAGREASTGLGISPERFASRQAQGVEKEAPVYYSKLRREIEAGQGKWRSGELLRALKAKGVKPEEMEWSRIEDLLKGKESVTKQEILDHLDANEVKVEEKVYGSIPGVQWDSVDNERGMVDVRATLSDGNEVRIAEQDNGKYALTSSGTDKVKPFRGWFNSVGEAEQYVLRNLATGKEHSPGATKYEDYQLPGGDNYRELLLTLPKKDPGIPQHFLDKVRVDENHRGQFVVREYDGEYGSEVEGPFASADVAQRAREKYIRKYMMPSDPDTSFRSQHFSEPNVLAHVRLNERTGSNGERILHVEEIQSDWHQKGRKEGYQQKLTTIEDLSVEEFSRSNDGFAVWEVRNKLTGETVGSFREKATPEGKDAATRRALERVNAGDLGLQRGEGVPDAPFKKTWPELAFKRVLRWAADNGFDRVTWTTGEQQAERYDLSKQVKSVEYDPGGGQVVAYDHNGREVLREESDPTAEALEKYIGKDPAIKLAEKIREQSSSFSREGWSVQRSDEGAWFEIFDPNGDPLYDRKGDIEQFRTRQAAEIAIDDLLERDRDATPKPSISGLDLKVGGEGMKGFYDAMLPTKVQDLVKKLDPSMRVGMSKIDTGEGLVDVHSIDLTPKAREVAKQGLPLFSSRQAETPEFKKWFGDSKVVDKNGKPLVVYHGTSHGFTTFNLKRAGENTESEWREMASLGHWFTPDPSGPNELADQPGGRVVPAYLAIRKPFMVTPGTLRSKPTGRGFQPHEDPITVLAKLVAEYGGADRLRSRLQRQGFDGVEIVGSDDAGFNGATQYVVFDPTQIKSATGNRGTFDPENPDIRYASRGIRPSYKDPRKDHLGEDHLGENPTRIEKSLRRQIDVLEKTLDAAYKRGSSQERIDDLETRLAKLVEREPEREGEYAQDREPHLEEGVGIEESLAKEYASYLRAADPKEREDAVIRMKDTLTLTDMGWSGTSFGKRPDLDAMPDSQVLDAAKDAYEARLATRQKLGARFASRAAQLPPHLQAMADDLQRRRGIPSPRKRADLGEAAKVTNALWDEFWEGAELERITKWREHPAYRDEWDSPTLVAKDAKSAGTENLFVKGVGSGGSKIKLPTGEEVEAGPVVLNRQTGTHEFATYVDSKGKTQHVPSLKAILSGLGESKADRLKDFRQFQHAVDLADAGIEHGTGYTRAEMQAFVDAVKNDPKQADIVEKSEQLTAYYNSLLDYAVSKGAVDAGLAAALKKKWPHFSPMERLFEQETGGDGGGNKVGTGSPLRKIKGSQRPVVDEVWQAIDRTHRWISQVDRNMAAANLWRMQNAIEGTLGGIAEPAKKKYTPTTLAQGLTKEGEIVTRRAKAQGKTLSVDEANQLGALIEPRHDFDKSTSVVSVVVDGKVKELRVDGVVRDFLTALNRVPDAPSESRTVRALTALATYPTSFLKWMVTGMPAFQMAQLVRDPATGTMQTKGTGGLANRLFMQPVTGRVLPLVEIARDAGRAIGSALGKAPDIEEARFQAMYQRSAGMFSNMSAHDFETKESVFNEIQDAIRHGSKAGTAIHYLKPGQLKWGHFLDNWLGIIEKGKAPFESATRKAIARQALKAGRNDLVAGTYARENTTNFATFGSAKWIRDANRFLPFLNAGLQSSRKFYLTMTGYDPISGKKNPKAAAEVWAKAFLWQTVPTMILWALNKGDDTIEEQRKGKNGLYYHYIRTPDIPELPEAIRGKVVAQPKAFTWATVFSTIPEAMLDALYQEKPEYLEENLIKPVRAMFNKDPHVYDAQKEVDYKPLGRVAKDIGNELKAGGLSPWINAYLGLKFNVDPFYGGKIEMEYQRNMDAPLRQGYRTGQLSKDLSQGMFNVAEKVDDTKAGEAFGTNVKGAVPGPDQIAFLANQVGLRDVYNLADRAYSEGTKREMPKGDYHPIQDLAGRRRFFPPDNRATGFASEAFADIAEKADTAVSSKKQLKKTDPLMLREYIQKRDTGFATAITKLKEQIDKLQKKRAQVSQMLTEDPAKRKQTLDELTRQIRGFQRRVIILTNEREKKREPK